MFKNIVQRTSSLRKNPSASAFLLSRAQQYLQPVEQQLEACLDKRLVRNFFDLFVAILMFRNRAMGLLLSELGGFICGFSKAPAGTKRISNLLRSKNWEAKLIDGALLNRTEQRLEELEQNGHRPLMLWDDSRVEKPESWFLEGLCSVSSSKGKRLTKIKRGYYNPPASRICVPGFHWTAVLLSYVGGVPAVCQMSWWTTRGKFKEDGSNITYSLLKKIHQQLGKTLTHVMDRAYANSQILEWLFRFKQGFIIRWKKNLLLHHHEKGTKQTHRLARSFRAQQSRILWDKERKKSKRVSVAWAPVQHPDYPDQPLFLLIARDKNHFNSPMYLLTSLNICTPADAWQVLFSYIHRWEIEQAFRFGKSELAMESPRLWFWENRLKLLAIVMLVYDFLLQLLRNYSTWVPVFLRQWCHRTGERYRLASIPLYRLRLAIHCCIFFLFAQNSG